MRTIMLIEDSKYIRENTEEILQVAGYEVFTAADGQQGLADTAIKNPDLVLCDIAMPVMSGYDVLNALRSDIFLHHIPYLQFRRKRHQYRTFPWRRCLYYQTL